MKLVSVVLSMFIVLFTITMTSCDSATDGGSNGQDTLIVSQDDYIPSSDSIVCDKCEDGQIHEDADDQTGDDTVHVDTVDPLADYYWLEGQWQRVEPAGYELIVDVTVEAWDKELGAEVYGFTPLNKTYIKKNAETDEFLLDVEYDSSTYAKGLADKDTLTFEFDFCTPCTHNIYKKL